MQKESVFSTQAKFIFCLLLVLPMVATSVAVADYSSTILAEPDLFAYWRFDQDSGTLGSTATDEVGGNNGTYGGADVAITAAGDGAPIFGHTDNKAADFEGVMGYIDVGRLENFGSVMNFGATIEMWVKSETGLGDGDQAPFGLYDDTGNNVFINLDEKPDGYAQNNRIRIYQSFKVGGADFDTEVTDGEWSYLAVVMNFENEDENERLKIYMAKPGDTATTEYTSTTPGTPLVAPAQGPDNAINFAKSLFIGAINVDGTPGVHFEGLVDELALYTSTLSKVQIDSHFTGGPSSIPGDANHDNSVDVSDLGILATNYGATSGKTWEEGDFTSDGAVDVSDLGILATNYGTTAAAAVPEPSVCGLLLTILSTFLLCRRNR